MEKGSALLFLGIFLVLLSADGSVGLPERAQSETLMFKKLFKNRFDVKRPMAKQEGEMMNSVGCIRVNYSMAEAEADMRMWMESIPVKNDSDYLVQTSLSMKDYLINGLPGQPQTPGVSFSQYSGYVTVNAKNGRALFYYFVEAVSNASQKPLILWLNGGPGCSSLGYGAMTELGPWRPNADGATLHFNKYSWNNFGNVLFLDAPVGVGYSYSNTSTDYAHPGDTPTALDNYAFLVNWFEIFPEYKNREFYIAGESYAGQYNPELAHTILAHKDKGQAAPINFKGMMVGNGLINYVTDWYGMYTYAWTHGLISEATYKALLENCLGSVTNFCNNATTDWQKEMGPINANNIYAPTCHQGQASFIPPPLNTSYLIPGYDPCITNYTTAYLNRPDVKLALHVNSPGLPYPFSLCSDKIHVNWNWTDSPDSMLPVYRELIKRKYKILVYSGDVDSNVPITSTRESLKLLNLTINTPWNAWISDDEVGGYKLVYEGLTFSSIRDAGHEVPMYQPSRIFQLLKDFVSS